MLLHRTLPPIIVFAEPLLKNLKAAVPSVICCLYSKLIDDEKETVGSILP